MEQNKYEEKFLKLLYVVESHTLEGHRRKILNNPHKSMFFCYQHCYLMLVLLLKYCYVATVNPENNFVTRISEIDVSQF